MNNKKQAQHYRKQVVAISNELRRLHKERNHFVAYLHLLNKKYTVDEISYSEYSQLWNSTITDLRYYEKYSQQLRHNLRESEIELGAIRDTEYNVQVTRVLSFTLITALLLFAGLSTLAAPPSAGITGFAATQANTTSLTEIQVYFAVNMSPQLENGMEFALPGDPFATRYNNATDNYDGSDQTQLWLTLDPDSNVPVDICVKADTNLTRDGAPPFIIEAGNLTWANSTTNSVTQPSINDATRFTFNYNNATKQLAIGDSSYFRLWVDIPPVAATGFYNNSLSFKSGQTGRVC